MTPEKAPRPEDIRDAGGLLLALLNDTEHGARQTWAEVAESGRAQQVMRAGAVLLRDVNVHDPLADAQLRLVVEAARKEVWLEREAAQLLTTQVTTTDDATPDATADLDEEDDR